MIEALLSSTGPASGEMVFTTPGTYRVPVPLGTETLSIVGIGAGSDGTQESGGAGGALEYRNAVSVAGLAAIEVTIGAGQDSVVSGLLVAAAASGATGGALAPEQLGGAGGDGGGYLSYGSGHGGGGGAAGRYDGPGGDGGQAESYMRQDHSAANWVRDTNPGTDDPDLLPYLYSVTYDPDVHASYVDALPPLTSFTASQNYKRIRVDWDGLYNFYRIQGITESRQYRTVGVTGIAGEGRGGRMGDGEGVDLYGSNLTPADNGHGYGGGQGRPGGTGAVRIIWGPGRAFPDQQVGPEFSERVQTF